MKLATMPPRYVKRKPALTAPISGISSGSFNNEASISSPPADNEYRNNFGFMLVDLGMAQYGFAQFQRLAAEYPDQAVIHYDLGLALKQQD